MSGYVEGKDKNQLLDDLVGTAEPGSPVHEQQKMGILVRCTEDLENSLKSLECSLNQAADSSNTLARRVFALNVILGIATLVGAAFAVAQFLAGRS